jgi:hypothetical protein
MTFLELSSIGLSHPESERDPEAQEDYPDEVLESEWNPVLEEISSLLPNPPEPRKPGTPVVDTAGPRRDH